LRWERKTRAASLQIARHAAQLRACPCQNASERDTDLADVVPSQESVELAENWTLTHLRRGSALATLMRTRVKEAVLDTLLVALFLSGSGNGNGTINGSSSGHGTGNGVNEAIEVLPSVQANGLEGLLREVKHLADKIWRLANIQYVVFLLLVERCII
jgi:hypothetical protein